MANGIMTEYQRAFKKDLDRLCQRFRTYEVWHDLIFLSACAISNAIDYRFRNEREQEYLNIIGKYNKEEQELFPVLFNRIIVGMEESPDSDFLGELYMAMELGNDAGGQFFTPFHVCQLMADMGLKNEDIKRELEEHGYITVNDCACGAGATLLSAAHQLKEIGYNYQECAFFVGQDIDYTTALMCYIQLSLRGCAGYVHIGNTLTEPATGDTLNGSCDSNTWYTPMYFSSLWSGRRNCDAMSKAIKRLNRSGGKHETRTD